MNSKQVVVRQPSFLLLALEEWVRAGAKPPEPREREETATEKNKREKAELELLQIQTLVQEKLA